MRARPSRSPLDQRTTWSCLMPRKTQARVCSSIAGRALVDMSAQGSVTVISCWPQIIGSRAGIVVTRKGEETWGKEGVRQVTCGSMSRLH